MTAPLPDDELRAMLEARADRVSSDASREAMAGFRSAVRGSADGRGGFSVLPQALGSSGARLPWGAAVIGIVAVVVIAVLGGQLSPPNNAAGTVAPPPSAAAIASPGTSAAGVTPDDSPSQPAGPQVAQVVGADQLQAMLASDGVAGSVVVIDGRLGLAVCRMPADATCPAFIDGLPGVPVTVPADVEFETGSGAATDESSGAARAFRVEADGSLVLLGIVEDGLPVPLSGEALARSNGPEAGLVLARGRLLRLEGPEVFFPCPTPGPSRDMACLLRATHILLDERHVPGGVLGAGVDLAPDVDAATLSVDGPATFVVRMVDGRWLVEGEQRLPTMTLGTAGDARTDLPAGDLHAGIADGSLDGRLVVLDGDVGLVPVACRRPGLCAIPAVPGLEDVAIRIDPVVAALRGPGSPSAPLVFVVGGGGLRHLGVAPGGLSIGTVRGLAAADPSTSGADVRLVPGVLAADGRLLSTRGGVAEAEAAAVPVTVAPDAGAVPGRPDVFLVRALTGSSCDQADVPSAAACEGVPASGWEVVLATHGQPVIGVR